MLFLTPLMQKMRSWNANPVNHQSSSFKRPLLRGLFCCATRDTANERKWSIGMVYPYFATPFTGLYRMLREVRPTRLITINLKPESVIEFETLREHQCLLLPERRGDRGLSEIAAVEQLADFASRQRDDDITLVHEFGLHSSAPSVALILIGFHFGKSEINSGAQWISRHCQVSHLDRGLLSAADEATDPPGSFRAAARLFHRHGNQIPYAA